MVKAPSTSPPFKGLKSVSHVARAVGFLPAEIVLNWDNPGKDFLSAEARCTETANVLSAADNRWSEAVNPWLEIVIPFDNIVARRA